MAPFVQDNLLVLILLGLCAIFAVFVIIGMVIGARNQRKRVAAEQEEEKRIEGLRADGVPVRTVDETGRVVSEDEAAPIAGAPAPTPTPAPPPAPAPTPASPPPPAPTPASPPPPAPVEADEPKAPDAAVDEPIPATAPLEASFASAVADAPVGEPAADGSAPLNRLKGLGPKIAARLEELGVTRVDQLAALDEREAQDLDARLGPFTGRMSRDRWVEQARLLTAGDRAGYEAQFGKLG